MFLLDRATVIIYFFAEHSSCNDIFFQNKAAACEKVWITETNEGEITHMLWTIAIDKLALVSNTGLFYSFLLTSN